jgi:hypothetical protein
MEALESRIVLAGGVPTLADVGPGTDMVASAADRQGNYYVAGLFHGKVDFNPRASRDYELDGGADSMFLARYSAKGELYWVTALRIPTPGNATAQVSSIATDDRGDAYLAGSFYGRPVREAATGQLTLSPPAQHDPKSTLWKFHKDGSFSFANRIEQVAHQSVSASHIAVDHFGSIYATSNVINYSADDPAQYTIQSLLTKSNANGVQIWSKEISDHYPSAVVIDRHDNPWVAVTHLNFSDPDIGLALEFNGRGRFLDSTAIASGFGSFSVESFAFDAEDNLITTGAFSGIWDFDAGAGERLLGARDPRSGYANAFVSKIRPNHDLVFANVIGGELHDAAEGVTVDDSGRITVAGMFNGTVDFDPSARGAYLLQSKGGGGTFDQSLFCASYDHAGRFLSASSPSGPDTSVDIVTAIFPRGQAVVLGNWGNKSLLWRTQLAA